MLDLSLGGRNFFREEKRRKSELCRLWHAQRSEGAVPWWRVLTGEESA
jgi:hypothetical protein